jgi:hypothetical protein
MLAELASYRPKALGLGIAFDELTGLKDHFVDAPTEPMVPLTGNEEAEVRGLVRFGEVRVPNPSLVAALGYAESHGVPFEALDLSDEHYATLFTDHISYLELVGRTVRERRLTRDPPKAANAEEYATRWHEQISRGKGSRSFDAARSDALVRSALDLARRVDRLAVIVDRERYPSVLAGVTAGLPG